MPSQTPRLRFPADRVIRSRMRQKLSFALGDQQAGSPASVYSTD
jgi:hypothetical protein